jgi:N-acetylated-alpha-linked acidic dipeptidase
MKHSLEALIHEDTLIISKTYCDTNETTTDLPKLASAIQALFKTSIKFDDKLQDLEHRANNQVDLFKKKKKHHNKKDEIPKQINKANERLVQFERAFVRNAGLLTGRPWYKHAIYGPSAKSGLLQVFPSIVESRELKDLKKLAETEEVLALVLKNAQRMLSKGKSFKHYQNGVGLFEDDEDDVLF